MGTSNYQSALVKRHSKLKGQLAEINATIQRIEETQKSIPKLKAKSSSLQILISSLENLLAAEDPSWQPEDNPAIKPFTYKLPTPFGTTSRRGLDVLRRADKPMTVRQIAIQVLCEAGHADSTKETILRTTNTIGASLRNFRGRTVESSGKYPEQWRVIHKDHIEFDI